MPQVRRKLGADLYPLWEAVIVMASGGRFMPYYHPSTVVIIDDDREFLDSFRSRFRRNLLCRTFDNPTDALRHIRMTTPHQPRHTDCITPAAPSSANGNQSVVFRPAVIRDLMHDGGRFQEVSVIIIDYDMPGERGLEVCRQLRDLPARKIMLTGAADEKLAMAAFNEGVIDRFVLKHDGAAVDHLGHLIQDLQWEYFCRIGTELESIIRLNESAFLADPVFCAYFDKVFEQEGAIEYFLSEDPPGVVLVRADGTVRTLLVQHNGALTVYFIGSGAGPSGFRERLHADDCQPWFPTKSGFYSDKYRNTWSQHLYPAVRVGPWYCSVIDDVAGRRSKRAVPSYEDYRRRLYQSAA